MSPEASTVVSAMPRDSRQWKVFHAADDFVVEVYAATPSFPKDETYGLTSQMRRAVVSVPANIVEGSVRDSEREFLQFLNIAYGSPAEGATTFTWRSGLATPRKTRQRLWLRTTTSSAGC